MIIIPESKEIDAEGTGVSRVNGTELHCFIEIQHLLEHVHTSKFERKKKLVYSLLNILVRNKF